MQAMACPSKLINSCIETRIFAIPLVAQPSRFPFLGVQIPQRDGVARPMGRLHLVRIPPIGPEEQNPIEDGLNVGYPVVAALREDSKMHKEQ